MWQCSVILMVRECLLMFKWNCLCFSLNPLLLALSLGTIEKSLDPSSSSHQELGSIDVIYLIYLFSRLNGPSSHSLSSLGRCFRPFIISVAFCWTPVWPCVSCSGELRTEHSTPGAHECCIEGKDYLARPDGNTLLNAAPCTSRHLCSKGTLLAYVQLCAH